MVAETSQPVGDLPVPRDHRPAVARGEVLRRVEREHGGLGEIPGAHAVPLDLDAVRGVLDDEEAVLIGEGPQRLHVGELSVQVNGEDPDRARTDCGADGGGIHEPRRRLHVDELRLRAQVENGARGRRERHRRGDDLVAGADVERPEREQKPHRARVGADDVGRDRAFASTNEEASELLLERRDLRPEGQKERVEDAAPGRGLVASELMAVELDPGHEAPCPTRSGPAASRRSRAPGARARRRGGRRTA